MRGKEKCKALKEIRKQIADNNDIFYVVSECKHQGECKGTCPKCEAEVLYLERELAKRQSLGKKVAVAGVAVGMAASMTGCVAADAVRNFFTGGNNGPDPNALGGAATVVENPPLAGEAQPVEIDGDVYVEIDSSEPCSDENCSEVESSEPTSVSPEDEVLAGEVEYIP